MKFIPLSDDLPDVPERLREWCWRSGYRTQAKLLACIRLDQKRWRSFIEECHEDFDALLARLEAREKK